MPRRVVELILAPLHPISQGPPSRGDHLEPP